MAFDPDAYLATPAGSPQTAPSSPSAPPPSSDGFDPDKYLASQPQPSALSPEAIKQSMFVASTKNPDEHAKVIDLSKRTGVPTNLIDKDTMGDVKEAAIQNGTDYSSLVKNSPKYSDWLTNPDNAAVSHDDIQTGQTVEKSVDNHVQKMNWFDSLWARIKNDADVGYQGSLTGMIADRSLPEATLPKDANPGDRLISGLIGYGADIPWFLAGGAAGALAGATAGATTMGLAGSAVPVAGTLAGIAAGAAGGGAVGGAYGAFSLQSALHTAVADYLKNGDPKDLPDFIARTKSALIEANKQGLLGVGLLGLGKVAQIGGEAAFGPVAEKVFGAGTKAAKTATKVATTATGLGAETVGFAKGQATIEGRDTTASDYMDAAAFIMTIHAATAGKEALAQSYYERGKAQQVKEFLQNLGTTTENSKLHARSPEVYGEMVDHLTTDKANPDLPIQTAPTADFVYFQPSAIDEHFKAKGIAPEKAMQELGALDSYEEAKKTGADVKISMSDFITKVSKTEHFDGLLNDAKTDPMAMSVNEANEAIKQNQEAMKAADQEAKAQAESAPKVDIAGPIKDQLLSTGRFTDKEAQLAADHHERIIEGISRSSGVPAADILKLYPLRIQDGSELINNTDASAVTLEQAHAHIRDLVRAEMVTPDAVERYKKIDKAQGGKFISTDEARALSGLYVKNPAAYLRYTHEYAREISWGAFLDRMSEPKKSPNETAMLLGGGTGSGKTKIAESEFLSEHYAKAHAIYDSTLSNYKDAKERIDHIINTGREVRMSFVYTHIDNALPRIEARFKESGRYVPNDSVVSSHVESIKTMIRLYDEFHDNPKFHFDFIDNNGDLTKGEKPKRINIEDFRKLVYTEPVKEIAERVKKGLENVTIQHENANQKVREEAARQLQNSPAADSGTGSEIQSGGRSDISQNGQGDGQPFGEMVQKRQSLNQGDESGPRGQISFGADNHFKIDFFKTADLSTAIHELSHFHFEVLGRLAQEGKASALVKDDYAKILKWLGADSKEAVTAEQHEQFARGIEAYLMEGKAPTEELRSTFARFKAWLIHIYKDIRNLKVELSPEIRNVFDRLVAADDQIKAAQEAQHQEPLFSPDGKIQMSPDRAEAYQNAREQSRAVAEARVTRKLMDDYHRAKSEVYYDKRKEIKASVESEINQRRVYKAIDTLQAGELADGTKIKLSKSDVIESWGAKAFQILKDMGGKYLYAREGGVHPDVAAHIFGYESGDAMMQDILNAPNKKDAIENATNDRMSQIFPDSYFDGSLPQESLDAVHNEKRAHVLRLELEELAQNHLPVLKDIIRRVARRVPTEAEVRDNATKLIGAKTVAELRPHIYSLAERKSAKLAGEALAKGDIDLAFDHKHKELLNHELYRAATDARAFIDKQLKGFRKLARPDDTLSKTRNMDLVNAARSILAKFGIGKAGKSPESYLDSLKSYDMDTYNNMMLQVQSAIEHAGDYKSVPFDQFVSMSDSVNAIYSLAKSMREITIDGKKMQMDMAHDELKARLSDVIGDPKVRPGIEHAVTSLEKLGMTVLSLGAKLTRVEHWISAVDGELKGQAMSGPFRKYIWEPVKGATTQYRLEKLNRMKELKKIFEDLNGRLSKEKIHSPELGYSPTKGEVLGMLLHSGNASNLEKLLLGRADKNGRTWGSLREDGTLDRSRFDAFMKRMRDEKRLTKIDYDFAQKIWDLFDSMKPGAQNAHKEMYGYHFNEITAQEFKNEFGGYRGGYVPAKIDHFLNEDQEIRLEREAFEKNNNSWQFPTTGRGFTKNRVESYHAPLSLDLNMLASHIDSVLRFTHIEPRVKEVGRLVSNKDFRSSLAGLNSEAGKDLLLPWLQSAASQRTSVPMSGRGGRQIDNFFRQVRTNVAIQTLVGNVANTFHNLTSGILANTKVSAGSLAHGYGSYIFDYKNTSKMVTDKSDYMRALKESHVRDSAEAIKKIIADPSGYHNFKAWVDQHGYFMQRAAQDIVTTSVWTGAYDQAVRRGADEQAAIKEADSIVSQTQHVGGAEDMAAYEKGTEFARVFTQMTGFFNKVLNVNVGSATAISRELGLKKGAAPLAQLYFAGFLMMAVSAQAVLDGLYGYKEEDDDGEGGETMNYLSHLAFGSQKSLAISMVPFAGPVINSALSHFGSGHGDDIRFSAAAGSIQSAARAPGEVLKYLNGEIDLDKKTTKDVLTLLGLATGLPFGVLGRPLGYLKDVESGKANPSGPIDYTRGLVTGAPGNN